MKYLCITIVTLVFVSPDIEAKKHAKGKSQNMHQQHIWINFDSAQMAKGKYHPWRSAVIFSKHHHLGAHLLQLEFGRWSGTSHTQFFDRPWPTKKHTEPTALLTRGQQFRPFAWCVWVKFAVPLPLKLNFLENWMDNTSRPIWYSTNPIETLIFSTITTALPMNSVSVSVPRRATPRKTDMEPNN